MGKPLIKTKEEFLQIFLETSLEKYADNVSRNYANPPCTDESVTKQATKWTKQDLNDFLGTSEKGESLDRGRHSVYNQYEISPALRKELPSLIKTLTENDALDQHLTKVSANLMSDRDEILEHYGIQKNNATDQEKKESIKSAATKCINDVKKYINKQSIKEFLNKFFNEKISDQIVGALYGAQKQSSINLASKMKETLQAHSNAKKPLPIAANQQTHSSEHEI